MAGSTGTNDCQTRELKEIDHRKNTDLQNLPLEEQLNEKKGELERIIETRTKGAILRSKTRWHNEGEKKY